ncbi:IclR family transcriptional regulator [Microbaculum marinisediminis]|uniref:IclR family transcriptional regulator n=1 Tax=Microbaculum marinisediminis TaxID=2931392 RepID=A0AAW5R6M9_9HYPH|nr:IclR family transcriptional regulator [Microbaculum sp. A6E488]MCT8974323.1 IclR family transcriptional regulator [Microbaculum sp. A6E488]
MSGQVDDQPSSSNVRAVVRAVAVLRAFSVDRPHLSLTEVVRITKLDKATTRRLLLTLIGLDLVVQDQRSHEYSLSTRMLDFVEAVPVFNGLSGEATPFMMDLAHQTQTTVFLSIYERGEAVCIARVQGDRAILVRWWNVGGRQAVNTGAAPRVLFAFQPPDEIERRLEKDDFPKLTPMTETSVEQLRDKLELVRSRGWDVAEDDVAIGLAAAGVPIFSRDGRIAAALSIGGLKDNIIDAGKPKHLKELTACARKISDIIR